MKAFGYFLLIPLSVILYFILAIGIGISQRYPIPHFLLMAIGLFFLFKLIRQKFSVWRLLLNFGGWALALLFSWWTLSYSNFGGYESPIALGDHADVMSVEVVDSTGNKTSIGALTENSKGVLIAFYRGHW